MRNIMLLLFITIGPLSAQTYTVENVPYDNLNNKYDFVSNPDGIISQPTEAQLNAMIVAVKDSASAEIAVVLLKSIGNADINDFGTELFTKWGIGKREKDNGLLFLLVEDQRQMLFRTGYGLEGVLPDAILSRIIRNDMAPFMSQTNPDQALLTGINKVCAYLLNPDAVREILAQEKEISDSDYTVVWIAGLLFIFFLVIAKKFNKKHSGNKRSFSGTGNPRNQGGLGGFGGKSSGGGLGGSSMRGGFSGGRTGGGGARGGW